MSACHYEMKFPIRPAPPPPVSQKPLKSASGWSDPVLDARNKSGPPVQKKKPPPRPPPPKFYNSKKSAPSRSSQVIADLFHWKNHTNSKASDPQTPRPFECPDSSVVMLIDFTSPPSSPTLTTRSSSDALSVNSFGSDGVPQCSGSSGNGSNVESGFEDDFDLFGASKKGEVQPRDPWSPPPKPPEGRNPTSGKSNSWVAFPSPSSSRKVPPGVNSMPTIIRSKPDGPRPHKICDTGSSVDLLSDIFQRANVGSSKPGLRNLVFEEDDDDSRSCESPPMPTCPPPAPPPEVLADPFEKVDNSESISFRGSRFCIRRESDNAKARSHEMIRCLARDDAKLCPPTKRALEVFGLIDNCHETKEARPHGIALYDYIGEQPQDLSFRKGDVINLVRKIDDNWYGGEMGGREGSVPVNFIAVRAPLPGDNSGGSYVTALYPFRPETWEDLAFEEGSVIKVSHRIDQDWLYGECDGRLGQFPASFVDHVPSDLPLRRTG